ncbi:MAG: hypothetical protein ACREMK_04460 [Gemmatimonadota bacterium]
MPTRDPSPGRSKRSGRWFRPLGEFAIVVFALAVAGCEQTPTEPDQSLSDGILADAPSAATADANGPFPSWKQGFNHGTGGWIDASTAEGPAGWCGDITQVDKKDGALKPSAGSGYAVVESGGCNDFWKMQGFLGSAPFSPGAGHSGFFPPSGYVMELDIYLDPGSSPGFTYVASMEMLDGDPTPLCLGNGFCYFGAVVAKSGGGLTVAGQDVTEAGWYTFRYVFGSDNGQLSVSFELIPRHAPALFSVPLTATFFTSAPTSSFGVANVSSGYVWFVTIDAGQLAIDEHQVRRGK